MKIFGTGRSHPRKKNKTVIILYVLLFFAISISTALCASGEGGTKGWVSTDTFRVMNFAVLAVALVYVLRKPLSQVLSSRIKMIKEQLDDLEKQKIEAEKQLAEYNEKLAQLEKEAEKTAVRSNFGKLKVEPTRYIQWLDGIAVDVSIEEFDKLTRTVCSQLRIYSALNDGEKHLFGIAVRLFTAFGPADSPLYGLA